MNLIGVISMHPVSLSELLKAQSHGPHLFCVTGLCLNRISFFVQVIGRNVLDRTRPGNRRDAPAPLVVQMQWYHAFTQSNFFMAVHAARIGDISAAIRCGQEGAPYLTQSPHQNVLAPVGTSFQFRNFSFSSSMRFERIDKSIISHRYKLPQGRQYAGRRPVDYFYTQPILTGLHPETRLRIRPYDIR